MREDLLGYLLDALDEDERLRVEEALGGDVQLQDELESLRDQLAILEREADEEPPPAGLVERTCAAVEAYRQQTLVSPASAARTQPTAVSRGRFRERPESASGPRRWSLADAVVATGIVLALAMLFFPALANSRFQSRIASCQYNLQRAGQALTDYSESSQGFFPRIPVVGNRAAAGLYAPILVENQYLAETDVLVCPGSRLADNMSQWRVPSLKELDQASGRQLTALQRSMGGSYGYTLGYLENDQYQTPRNEGRAYFALMSDAPSLHMLERRSVNHGGYGQNVLFEDNHVEFVVDCVAYDRLFVNRDGYAEAGLDESDSVIGHSAAPPFVYPTKPAGVATIWPPQPTSCPGTAIGFETELRVVPELGLPSSTFALYPNQRRLASGVSSDWIKSGRSIHLLRSM